MSKKILTVDYANNPNNNSVKLLQGLGYENILIENVDNMIKILETNIFDLIFINNDMKSPDAIGLLTQIKSHPVFFDIPIIILSSIISDSLIETCFSYGADDIIEIPTSEFLMRMRVKSAFEKQGFVLKIQAQRDELKMQKKIVTENEERAKKIMETINAGLLLVEPVSNKIIEANSHAISMLGYNKKEILQLSTEKIFELKSNNNSNLLNINFETKIHTKRGETIEVLKNNSEVKIKGQSYLLQSFIDISEQKNIQKKLEEQAEELQTQRNEIEIQKNYAIQKSEELALSEQKLQTIIDTSLSGISILDSTGEFSFFNSIFNKLFKYTDDEFRNLSYFDLIPDKDVEEAMNNHKMLIMGEITFIEKIRTYIRKDGSKFWGHVSASPIIGTDGKPEGIVSFLTDIDKLKRSEIEIKKKNINIKSAITYAQRIQNSLLPSNEYLKELLPEHFLIYRPKDVVSGDFYWIKQINEYILIAAADCTGHGVPGAFMSLLFISILNKVINTKKITTASAILDEVKKELKIAFSKGTGSQTIQDGMDIALLVFNTETNICQFSGAYNPLYFFRNGNLTEIKATPMPIGNWRKEMPFVNHEFKIDKDDLFYIFSDGFYDQVGGSNNKKFMKGHFRELLSDINTLPISQQEKYLNSTLDMWQGKNEQVDDIIVIGFKLPVNKTQKNIYTGFYWGGKTILIVEDNYTNFKMLNAILSGTKANIIWAKNGEEAVEYYNINKNEINIILMDVMLPVMDGNTALKIIKEINNKLPIIVQTAITDTIEKSKSFEAGCDDYITKPINRRELLVTIGKYI